MPQVTRFGSPVALFLALLTLAACGKDSPTGPPAPARVAVTPSSVVLDALGATVRLSATTYDRYSKIMSDARVSWSSSDGSVATVSPEGVVTALRNGAARITAESGGATVVVTVTVAQSASRIVVTPSSIVLDAPGATVRLHAAVRDANDNAVSDASVSWSSSDGSVADVSPEGVVTALENGAARITAHSGDATGSAEVTVMGGDPQRDALVALYHAMDGPNWTDATGWLSEAPLEAWYGVATDAEGVVRELNLEDNGLAGTLPPGLGRLSGLATLNLSANWLTGTLPSGLGELPRLSHLLLSDNALDGPIPPELGRLSGLAFLDLSGNELAGPIPPELGRLTGLVYLFLNDNALTGPLPPELGGLAGLRYLDLFGNQLTGSLPPELGSLANLNTLDLTYNGLTGPLPPELGSLANLKTLYLRGNQLTGPLPSELGGLTSLRSLDLAENGFTGSLPPELGRLSSLTNLDASENGFTGPLPSELGGLDNLEYLILNDNGFTGPLPSELGSLSRLEIMRLSANAFTGPLPSELGGLSGLKTLSVTRNPGLSGPLPLELAGLRLEGLFTGGTQLCAPADAGFQAWLRSVPNRRVVHCAGVAGGPRAYLTQATQSFGNPVPLVAGEDALLRVFVTADRDMDAAMPPVRAIFYQHGNEVHRLEIPGGKTRIPREIDEGDLSTTANAVVPGEVLMPPFEMVIEIDPEGTAGPDAGIGGRVPPTGRAFVDVRRVVSLDLYLVPFLWVDGPDQSLLEDIRNLTPDDDFFWRTRNLLPVSDFQLRVREPLWTAVEPVETNLNELLGEVVMAQVLDGSSWRYMGVVRKGGIALTPGFAGVSALDARVMAHELGHTMNLLHAPCDVFDYDLDYPYEGGVSGAWGYDFRTGRTVHPETPDLMTYCGPPDWISDYHFTRAINFRDHEGASIAGGILASAGSLLVRGGIDGNGALFLDPAFAVDAPPSLPGTDGPYRLTGQDADGGALFTVAFDMAGIADGQGGVFAFVLPARADWSVRLHRIALSGPEGVATLDADSPRQASALLLDPSTGQVRGILRDWQRPDGGSQAARRTMPEPGLDVVISSGIPDRDSW